MDLHEQQMREELQRIRMQVAAHNSNFPVAFAGFVMIFAFLIASVLAIYDISSGGPARRQLEIEAEDKARLECRLAGGQMESFGTQGTHCVGKK
jgi:hypothetical protein